MLIGSRTVWSVVVVCPGLRKFRRRISIGESPTTCAMRSMCRSSANRLCGAPKPRNAPWGGALVATAFAEIRTLGQIVGAAGMNRSARKHHRGKCRVGPAVDRNFNFAA